MLIKKTLIFPTVPWAQENFGTEALLSRTDSQTVDTFSSLGLEQLVNEPTNFPYCIIIVLVLCSHRDKLENVEVLAPFSSCSHGVLFYEYFFQESNSTRKLCTKDRLWPQGKHDLISRSLQTIHWHFGLFHLDVEEMYHRLCSILY